MPVHRPTPEHHPMPEHRVSVPSFLVHDIGRVPPPPRLHSHRRGLQEHADSCFPTPTVSVWLTARYVFDEMPHGVAVYLNQ